MGLNTEVAATHGCDWPGPWLLVLLVGCFCLVFSLSLGLCALQSVQAELPPTRVPFQASGLMAPPHSHLSGSF